MYFTNSVLDLEEKWKEIDMELHREAYKPLSGKNVEKIAMLYDAKKAIEHCIEETKKDKPVMATGSPRI